jgi:hypothetical protein
VERPQTGNRSLKLAKVDTREINVASMSDTDLENYVKLLGELKELLPSEKDTTVTTEGVDEAPIEWGMVKGDLMRA